ncbi:MAG: DUF177 domain-containing protein [Oscillospiraceae bacterium]|nr:DUF177 domain-containing protein [Oscillospiraceae bacterium]
MWLDLHEIIEMPGTSKAFDVELDEARLCTQSIRGFKEPPRAQGRVENTAGVLTLRVEISAEMQCVCDRCGTLFDREKRVELAVPLAADLPEGAESDAFPLDGNGVDLSEVLETCFILETESRYLCREDCKGLCPICGRNLNDGTCACKPPPDPRLAVLGQLLEPDAPKDTRGT